MAGSPTPSCTQEHDAINRRTPKDALYWQIKFCRKAKPRVVCNNLWEIATAMLKLAERKVMVLSQGVYHGLTIDTTD